MTIVEFEFWAAQCPWGDNSCSLYYINEEFDIFDGLFKTNANNMGELLHRIGGFINGSENLCNLKNRDQIDSCLRDALYEMSNVTKNNFKKVTFNTDKEIALLTMINHDTDEINILKKEAKQEKGKVIQTFKWNLKS